MAIGRFVWDTWIMSRALHSDYPTINGANKIQAYHINHHYSIKGLPQTGLNNAPLDKKKESPEFRENMRLGEANGGILGGELQCSEYLVKSCTTNLYNLCLVPNAEHTTDYCKHTNNHKIPPELLDELNNL
eukprot:TRINITY_DN1708_c0_g1_i18.p1 TRINITY_DN1708_c0_g1~~TRINITY_DN1708_c0_g1_i18.p1  ORF type:complete len:131 (+),score=19.03 TRINITY_DN1708_c0_g1_i18:902-1294(+)